MVELSYSQSKIVVLSVFGSCLITLFLFFSLILLLNRNPHIKYTSSQIELAKTQGTDNAGSNPFDFLNNLLPDAFDNLLFSNNSDLSNSNDFGNSPSQDDYGYEGNDNFDDQDSGNTGGGGNDDTSTPTPISTPTPTNNNGTPTPTPTTNPTNTPTPTNSPTPTPIQTIKVGSPLGRRPVITGGGTLSGITDIAGNQSIFLPKVKSLGITNIRLMNVMGNYMNNGDTSWGNLKSAIHKILDNGQIPILCLGTTSNPDMLTDAQMANYANALGSMLDTLVTEFGINQTNTFFIELNNEYGYTKDQDGYSTLQDMIVSYNTQIKSSEGKNAGLHVKVLAPSPVRGAYYSFGEGLKQMQSIGMNVAAISAHYYFHGNAPGVGAPYDLYFQDWLSNIQQKMNTYGYGNLPIYITEFGFNGDNKDVNLTYHPYGAWLASRLGNSAYYNSNLIFFFSAVWGQSITQPANPPPSGLLGLYEGYTSRQAPYPVQREFEMESKFGNNNLSTVNNLPANIGGVTDQNQWLLWNNSSSSAVINLESSSSKLVGLLDSVNGNSIYQLNQPWAKAVTNWNAANKSKLDQFSDAFNDPTTGNKRIISSNNGVVSFTIGANGTAFITSP